MKRKYALHLGMEVPVVNAQKLSEGRCLRQRPSLNFLVRFLSVNLNKLIAMEAQLC